MMSERSQYAKKPVHAERSYPLRCPTCGKKGAAPQTIVYEATHRHDGRSYIFTIPDLVLPICGACGEKVFTEEVLERIQHEFRKHLKLLSPLEIRAALLRVGMSQKEACERLGIAEATLSRWLSEVQLQSRSLDNLMRTFFAFPEVRDYRLFRL